MNRRSRRKLAYELYEKGKSFVKHDSELWIPYYALETWSKKEFVYEDIDNANLIIDHRWKKAQTITIKLRSSLSGIYYEINDYGYPYYCATKRRKVLQLLFQVVTLWAT